MIPGASANGVYPNHSIGLPASRQAIAVTVKVFATKRVANRQQPRKIKKLAKFPN